MAAATPETPRCDRCNCCPTEENGLFELYFRPDTTRMVMCDECIGLYHDLYAIVITNSWDHIQNEWHVE